MATSVELVERQELCDVPTVSTTNDSREWQSDEEEPFEENLKWPPPYRGKVQLQAMLHRQWLLKKRGWQQTAMELISPLLMMTLLVLGWSRSTEDHFKAEVFANASVPVFATFKEELLLNSRNILQLCPPSQLAQQHVSAEELALIVFLMREEVLKGLDGLPSINVTSNTTLGDAFSWIHRGTNPSLPLSPALLSLTFKCVDSAKQVSAAIRTFDAYHGPSPVPSFDTFVQVHKLVQQTLKSGTSKQYEEALRIQRMFGNLLGNLLALGRITFAPNSTEVAALVDHLNATSEFFQEVYGGTFPNEQEAVKSALTTVGTEKPIWAIIIVNHMNPLGGYVDYKIRMNFTTVPHTWGIVHKRRKGLLTYYKHYYTSGFLSLQDAINSYVLQLVPTQKEVAVLTEKPMWGAPFPTPQYTRNKFYRAKNHYDRFIHSSLSLGPSGHLQFVPLVFKSSVQVGPLLGLMMCLTTLYPLGMLVKALVEEKESRAKETMYIMGLKPWVFNTAWLLTYLVVFFSISISVTALLSLTVFRRSDSTLLFMLFFLFAVSLIPFGFFLSVFFSKAKLAAIVAPFVHFAAIMPRYIFFRASSGQAIPGKTVAALLPPTAYTFGVDLVALYEGAGYGLTWANVLEDEFSVATILVLLLADSLVYAALAWYLEQVLPSEYGAIQPPWFLFLPSYWGGRPARVGSAEYQRLESIDVEEEPAEDIEPYLLGGRRPSVHIQGLRKVYGGGKVAVDGLTLDLFEDQITALLGHNGAGKSTTISMLTGLTRPSSGNVHILGHSIRKDMKDIRRILGVCPQQNMLFSYLTVGEHLELFATLKGVSKLRIPRVVQDMAASLGLRKDMKSPASSLSGGQQRKLQVGLAMIGGSRVVFLDEPTSGLDPQSRRKVWELLRYFKAGRAIVLTTHHMDEADLLCDRIAIMSEGRLRCCGSSLFLKGKFGVGYNLSMTGSDSSCSDSAIAELVLHHVPQAVPLSSAGGEMSFQLPFSKQAAFAHLLQELEQKLDTLHIGSYGISMTTLEEVFLRLTEKDHAFPESLIPARRLSPDGHEQALIDPQLAMENRTEGLELNGRRNGSTNSQTSLYGGRYSTHKKERSFGRAFGEMYKKRALIARRDVKALANSILLPVIAIGFVMLILNLNIDPAGPKLQLNFDMYSTLAGSKGSPQKAVVPVAGAAPTSLSILGGSRYLEFDRQDGINDSIQLSDQLLRTYWAVPARFGGLVFNDTLLPKFNTTSIRKLNLAQVERLLNISHPMGNKTLENLHSFQTKSGSGLWAPVTLLHNTTSDHSLPALIQELAQARLQAALKNSMATLNISSHPLPLTTNEALRVQTILTALAALFVLIPFSYCAASFAVFVVQERVVKAKLLQMVSGASTYSYWAATYAWDMSTYAAIVGLTMLVFVINQDQSFIGSWAKAGAVVSMLLAFGLSVVPLSYCYSFAFSNHANAQVAIAGLHFITGFGMLVGSIVMSSLENAKLFPPFNLGRGLANLAALDLESTLKGGTGDPYEWDVIGKSFTLMLVEAAGFSVLTLLIDNNGLINSGHSLFAQPSYASPFDLHSGELPEKEDIDVRNERKRVEGGLAAEDTVMVHRLRKVYRGHGVEKPKLAVKNLSLGIPAGQCFGFLGVNGAGKTTTLSILSGDIKPTSGELFICGNSVLTELTRAQKQMGYCPQFNPLLDLMTAREHLQMYASLKGVPSHEVKVVVNDLVEAVGLQKYVDCVAGTYSGGNKRKLSLAIALVGDPSVVFLDEPSSGMDPITRRAMWNLIKDAVVEKKMSVVLTTHSMEECEALCGRVGVMVAGSLVCLGSIQHIKSRFGNGYTVELRCKSSAALKSLHQFMKLQFPVAILEEEHMLRVKYCLPNRTQSLSHVFAALEEAKDRLGLEDYSVSQSSLEQIFLSLANGHIQDEEQLLIHTQ